MVPALDAYRPELILVACVYDAGKFDPLGRMLLDDIAFRWMTQCVADVARATHTDDWCCCTGRLLPVSVPFWGLAVLEELAGERTDVECPFTQQHDHARAGSPSNERSSRHWPMGSRGCATPAGRAMGTLPTQVTEMSGVQLSTRCTAGRSAAGSPCSPAWRRWIAWNPRFNAIVSRVDDAKVLAEADRCDAELARGTVARLDAWLPDGHQGPLRHGRRAHHARLAAAGRASCPRTTTRWCSA